MANIIGPYKTIVKIECEGDDDDGGGGGGGGGGRKVTRYASFYQTNNFYQLIDSSGTFVVKKGFRPAGTSGVVFQGGDMPTGASFDGLFTVGESVNTLSGVDYAAGCTSKITASYTEPVEYCSGVFVNPLNGKSECITSYWDPSIQQEYGGADAPNPPVGGGWYWAIEWEEFV